MAIFTVISEHKRIRTSRLVCDLYGKDAGKMRFESIRRPAPGYKRVEVVMVGYGTRHIDIKA